MSKSVLHSCLMCKRSAIHHITCCCFFNFCLSIAFKGRGGRKLFMWCWCPTSSKAIYLFKRLPLCLVLRTLNVLFFYPVIHRFNLSHKQHGFKIVLNWYSNLKRLKRFLNCPIVELLFLHFINRVLSSRKI